MQRSSSCSRSRNDTPDTPKAIKASNQERTYDAQIHQEPAGCGRGDRRCRHRPRICRHLARRTGARVQDIINANKITDPAKIQVGQTLFIPGGK